MKICINQKSIKVGKPRILPTPQSPKHFYFIGAILQDIT